jgi:hypothetical protein
LFVDAGYNFYEWEDYLLETEELRCKFRANPTPNAQRAVAGTAQIDVRKYIETTIGEISKLFPKEDSCHNLNVFC